MELIKAYLVVLGIVIAVLCVAYSVIIRILDAASLGEDDPDIIVTHHKNSFGYYFFDPHDTLISRGGFRTEAGARRAGQQHRDLVGKELQEAMGL
jgi:hypothetical protein